MMAIRVACNLPKDALDQLRCQKDGYRGKGIGSRGNCSRFIFKSPLDGEGLGQLEHFVRTLEPMEPPGQPKHLTDADITTITLTLKGFAEDSSTSQPADVRSIKKQTVGQCYAFYTVSGNKNLLIPAYSLYVYPQGKAIKASSQQQ
jgi:hypothetical protein